MAQEIEPVSFDEFLSNADSIFAQIEQEGKGFLVEHDGVLFSVEMKRSRTKKRGRAITAQDSLLRIVGIGASRGPTDTSVNKHSYLADASGDLHINAGICFRSPFCSIWILAPPWNET